MFTKILTKEGEELNFVTQQYSVGTYVIINNDPSKQFGVDMKEDEYHKKLRITCIKGGDTLVGGTELTLKSKFPINKFQTK
jgi:hypothetical protein